MQAPIATAEAVRRRRVALMFVASWAVLLVLNVGIGHPTCWFYSDEAGEYAVSETLTVVFYAIAIVIFGRRALANRSPELAAIAIAALWFMLEESNYGQVYWSAGTSNYFHDSEQLSLHASAGVKEMKTALTAVVSAAIVVGIPLVLGRVGVPLREPSLWLPLLLLAFIHFGNYVDFLSPRECGLCADNELAETLLASATAMFAMLIPSSRAKEV